MPKSRPMTAPMMVVRARLPPLLLDDALFARLTTAGSLDLLHACKLQLGGGQIDALCGELGHHGPLTGPRAVHLRRKRHDVGARCLYLTLERPGHLGVPAVGSGEGLCRVRIGQCHRLVGAVGLRGDAGDGRLVAAGGARRARNRDVHGRVDGRAREASCLRHCVNDGITLQDGGRSERVGAGGLGEVAHHRRGLTEVHLG